VNKKLLNRLARLGVAFSFALFVVLFVFVPTRSVTELMNRLHVSLSNYYNLGLFASLLATAIFWMIQRATKWERIPTKEPAGKPKSHRWLWGFQAIASIFIFYQSVAHVIDGPLDSDETYISVDLTQGRAWESINPLLSTRNHGLTTLAAYLSGKTFGWDEVTIRYPAILFLVLFLALANYFCFRFASPFTTVLVFGHLCVNQLALWYFHSMRGYTPMMTWTLGGIFLVADQRIGNRARLVGFAVLGVLAALTHTFAGFFFIILLGTLLYSLAFQPKQLGKTEFDKRAHLLWAAAIILPLAALLCVSQALAIKSLGFFNVGKAPDVSFELIRLLGIQDPMWGRLVWLLAGGVVAHRIYRRHKVEGDFYTPLLITAALFIGGIAWALQVVLLEGRMLLAFLLPFLFWVGQEVDAIKNKTFKIVGVGLSALVLVVAPYPSTQEIFNIHPEIVADYRLFIKEVRKQAPPIAENCFSVDGAPWAVKWTRGLYLNRANFDTNSKQCKNFYHLFYETGYDASVKLGTPEEGYYQLMYADGKGRYLYRHVRDLLVGSLEEK